MDQRMRVISVIGAGSCSAGQARLAEEVGRLLAENGVVLVCGGRGGVMEAACRGAMQAGGITIGLLPGSSVSEGNAFLTIALPTGLGDARNALIAQAGSSVIAIGGGPGTLSEIGFALKMGRRVITLRSWEMRDANGEMANVMAVDTPAEAVALALSKEV